ncbi:hypothetical protein IWQ49_003056 [Labrenzia sp. EL_126]|nr:hypothetical protein [Labrenzia sp. EL_126]
MQRRNTYQRFQVPDGLQLTLFLIAFVATVSPYISGIDLGFVKVPDLSSLPYLKFIGPISLLFFIFGYLTIWPTPKFEEQPNKDDQNASSETTLRFLSLALVTSADHQEFSSFDEIASVWKGDIKAFHDATAQDFCDAVLAGPDILQIEATVSSGRFLLSDKEIDAQSLGQLLQGAEATPKLVILSACDSFRVAQEMENTGIRWSIVAHASLPVEPSAHFFKEFYKSLADDGDVRRAYYAAQGRAAVIYSPRELPLSLTEYG